MDKVRLVTRNSPLAIKQVEEVLESLPAFPFELIRTDSFGDKHKEMSLLDGVPEDFFTRELDTALLNKEADVAVHSAKDLPYPLPEGHVLAALTKGLDPSDSLVSRDGLKLHELPSGARVGLSSPTRRKSINDLRPDIEIVSIRGTIAERLDSISRGDVDAVVVATCALIRLGLIEKASEKLSFETHPLQGKLAVVVRKQSPALRRLFYPIDARKYYGSVWLIGGGPGDPELLTVKAERLLKNADVIVTDELTATGGLSRYSGEIIRVGKRKGQHTYEQEEINKMMADYALQGKKVVRLKGGDPSLFGRMGEELEYLERRFIQTEIVPGVTSAFAAAADASISLTLRGVASGTAFITAHNAYEKTEGSGLTRVFYMGASRQGELSEEMIKEGLSADTPVLLVQNAGTESVVIEKTDLRGLKGSSLLSPLVIIAGRAVDLYHKRETYLFTGLEPGLFPVRVTGHIVHQPLIELIWDKDATVPDWKDYEALILTSVNAAKFYLGRERPRGLKIYTIGPSTTATVHSFGLEVEGSSNPHESGALAELLIKSEIKSALYPCSGLSDNAIMRLPFVTAVPIYTAKTRKNVKPVNLQDYEGVVFTSPSGVRAFIDIYGKPPSFLLYYAMGGLTAKALRDAGVDNGGLINVQEIQE